MTCRSFPRNCSAPAIAPGSSASGTWATTTAPAGFDHWVAMPGQGEAIDPSLNVDGKRVQEKGYTTDLLTDYAERFIDRPSDSPFLVYLAHKAIHPNVIQ